MGLLIPGFGLAVIMAMIALSLYHNRGIVVAFALTTLFGYGGVKLLELMRGSAITGAFLVCFCIISVPTVILNGLVKCGLNKAKKWGNHDYDDG